MIALSSTTIRKINIIVFLSQIIASFIIFISNYCCATVIHSRTTGTCKVRNETKRNKSKRNEADRNETKRIETQRNKTKRSK